MPQTDLVSLHFTVQIIGQCRLSANHSEITIKAKKARLLIAMLSLAEDYKMDRLSIAKTLWSRHADEQALNSLRQTLATLKRELGEYFDRLIIRTRQHLSLYGSLIECDFHALDASFADALPVIRLLSYQLPLSDLNFNDDAIQDWICKTRYSLLSKAIEKTQRQLFDAGETLNAEQTSECQRLLQALLRQQQNIDVEVSQLQFKGIQKTRLTSGAHTEAHTIDTPVDNSTLTITRFLNRDDKLDDHAQDYCCFLTEKGRNFWVDGFLSYNFQQYHEVDLALLQSDKHIHCPYDHLAAIPGNNNNPIPLEGLLEKYIESQGKILILGQPGSGKTTLTLKLLSALLKHVSPERHAIPVFFNISQGLRGLDVKHWLLGELDARYDIPKAVGIRLIEHNRLLLFIDGLDEAPVREHNTIVNALNQFMRDHPKIPLTVSVRISDYESCETLLRLNTAYNIQNIHQETVQEYILNYTAGQTLVSDSTNGMIRTPLELRAALCLLNNDANLEPQKWTTRDQCQAYIDTMLSQAEAGEQRSQLQRFLPQLAALMTRNNQSQFFLEDLTYRNIKSSFGALAARILPMGIVAATVALIISITCYMHTGSLLHSIIPWPLALVGVLTLNLSGEDKKQKLLPRVKFSWQVLRNHCRTWFINTSYAALSIGGVCWFFYGLKSAAIVVMGVIITFALYLALDFKHTNKTKRSFIELNEPVKLTQKNALRGLGFGAAIGCGVDILLWREWQFGTGILLFGTIVFFILGGLGIVQHYITRAILAMEGSLPFYINENVDLSYRNHLLNKVGGGIIFPHRLIQQHLSDTGSDNSDTP